MVQSKEKDERNVMWHVTDRYRTGQLLHGKYSQVQDWKAVMWHVTVRYRTGQLSQVFVQNVCLTIYPMTADIAARALQ
jgi:hypothetical protein